MSTAKLVKWGNSLGLRIPIQDIKMINGYPGEEFKISVTEEGGLNLTPINHSEQAWLAAFNAAADAGDDAMLIEESPNDFDRDEWKW